jgi:Trk K+ transport system NAD-binding subunit
LKVSPPPDYEFKKGDLMVILGKNSSLDEFKKHVEQQNNS